MFGGREALPIARGHLLHCKIFSLKFPELGAGTDFPSAALWAMSVPDSSNHLEGKQAKPLITPMSPVDTVFPLSDCI